MTPNCFMDPGEPPTDTALKSALGDRFSWYEALLAAGTGYQQEWKHYGKKYGWKLKVHDGRKTLFEVTIETGSFRIGMAVREKELTALRNDEELANQLGELLSAEKASEGWGIRLTVDSEARYSQALALVAAVAPLRSPGAAQAD